MPDLPSTISELPAGSVIEFDDITELPAFEDQLANEIDPYMGGSSTDMWAGRTALRDFIRPPKFNGRIGNIVLHVLENPYEQLITAGGRGVKFTRRGGSGGSSAQLSSEFEDVLAPLYKGFLFTASANSSGRGEIGQIQSELYYCPSPLMRVGNGIYKNVTARAGASVLRIVSKPVIVAEDAFTELEETSRRIAYRVLSDGLKNPLPQPFRN
mgnify:CR=1 FL=1